MNHHPTRLLVSACLMVITLGPLGAMRADANQPRLDKAIRLLEVAKNAPKPVPLLEKAKTHVTNAAPNKGGLRLAAIKAINEAILIANADGNAVPKIKSAIAFIRAGKKFAIANR